MPLYQNDLPLRNDQIFLTYTGMETDLIFTQGIELPGFASFPLLASADGRRLLNQYYEDLITLGQNAGLGVILEAPTWVANAARAAPLGYDTQALEQINRDALELIDTIRSNHVSTAPVLLSANIGPKDDAYAPSCQMTAPEAQAYHLAQIKTLQHTATDVVSGYTLAYPAEAIGIIQAARQCGLRVVIAFTVETDGRLPTGQTLQEALETVDAATEAYASYFMINCAHPDHLTSSLSAEPWAQRVKGIVANASRCSHAELDAASELDAGDPAELGQQLVALREAHPQLTVLGGCCGTDMRHLSEIARQLAAQT
ncbi:MAG: homocysteine S-methyltransferase family protein [Thalassovita sp.]